MVHAAQKGFPGFGVVYPGGGQTGLKVVGTFTQGSTKTVHPDGSVTHSIPPPVVHELFGGGFAYANGSPVTNREHLELITDAKMKERALKWFDMHGVAITPQDVVVKDEEAPTDRPEPAFIVSTDVIDKQGDFVGLENKPVPVDLGPQRPTEESVSAMSLLAKGMSDVMNLLGSIDARLTTIETEPKPKRRPTDMESTRTTKMRAKWADPEYRKKRLEAMRKGRKKGDKDETGGHEVTQEDGEGAKG